MAERLRASGETIQTKKKRLVTIILSVSAHSKLHDNAKAIYSPSILKTCYYLLPIIVWANAIAH